MKQQSRIGSGTVIVIIIIFIDTGLVHLRSLENNKAIESIKQQLGSSSDVTVVTRAPQLPLFKDGDIIFTFQLESGEKLVVTCSKRQGQIVCPIIGRPDLFK